MENGTMKLLYINTEVHALISINQSAAGETGGGPLTLPIAANSSFFITMQPLKNEKNLIYLPYTKRISTIAGGMISGDDGLVELCTWPDSIIELHLNPLTIYKYESPEISPAALSPLNFQVSGSRYTAYIYNDAGSSFAVETPDLNRLVFISQLPFYASSAEVTMIRIGDDPYLCAAGKTTESKSFIYIANTQPSFGTCLCTECESYEIGGGSLSVVTEGDYRQLKTTYESREGVFSVASKELGWFTCEEKTPSSPEESCACLLQAVKENMPEAAMKSLTPSLAEGLSFADLKEFFGDFTVITRPISSACAKSSIALKYPAGKNIYIAREFCVETKIIHGDILIDNLREP